MLEILYPCGKKCVEGLEHLWGRWKGIKSPLGEDIGGYDTANDKFGE